MVIYISVGSVIALVLLSSAAFVFWCYRKKRQKKANRFVQIFAGFTNVSSLAVAALYLVYCSLSLLKFVFVLCPIIR